MGHQYSQIQKQSLFQSEQKQYFPQSMNKVWNFSNFQLAQNQISLVKKIKQNQQSSDIKIKQYSLTPIQINKNWKVIVTIQYPTISIRKQIIKRKKSRIFFINQQLRIIFGLIVDFVLRFTSHLCSHIDIFSYMFLIDNNFMICHPELLYSSCSKQECSSKNLKDRLVQNVFQMLLLEKIFKPDGNHINKINNLYRYSWLTKLCQEILGSNLSLVDFCKKYLYIKPIQSQLKTTQHDDCLIKSKITLSLSRKNNETLKETPQISPRFQQHEVKINFKQNNYQKGILSNIQKQFVQSVQDDQQSVATSFQHHLNTQGQSSSFTKINKYIDNLYQDTYGLNLYYHTAKSHNQTVEIHQSQIYSKKITPILEQQNQNTSQNSLKFIEGNDQLTKSWDIIQYEDGKYEGAIKNRKKHGKGKFTFNDGVYYDGDWQNDEMNGSGELYYPSNKIFYKGNWKNGEFHGKGKLFNERYEQYSEKFDYTNLNQINFVWISFQGYFNHDLKEGEGQILLSNGERFIGYWKNNSIQGRGKYITKQGQVIEGVWVEGKLQYLY